MYSKENSVFRKDVFATSAYVVLNEKEKEIRALYVRTPWPVKVTTFKNRWMTLKTGSSYFLKKKKKRATRTRMPSIVSLVVSGKVEQSDRRSNLQQFMSRLRLSCLVCHLRAADRHSLLSTVAPDEPFECRLELTICSIRRHSGKLESFHFSCASFNSQCHRIGISGPPIARSRGADILFETPPSDTTAHVR